MQGMSDAMWLMDRGDNSNSAFVKGRGRDISDFEYSITWNPETWRYDFLGQANIIRLGETKKLIIDVMKEEPKICNYLDMPLQHASDNMLKAMKRQITRQEMKDLIGEIRSRIPGICLRTTLIAGFPGETREDVEEVKEFLAEMQFDRVGIFTYSHEEDTSAHALEDTLSAEEKEARAQEIIEFQQEISFEKNQSMIGQTLKVIVDKKEAGRYIGRTEFDSVEVDNEVIIHSSRKLNPGDFVNVIITKAYDYDLEGDVV